MPGQAMPIVTAEACLELGSGEHCSLSMHATDCSDLRRCEECRKSVPPQRSRDSREESRFIQLLAPLALLLEIRAISVYILSRLDILVDKYNPCQEAAQIRSTPHC